MKRLFQWGITCAVATALLTGCGFWQGRPKVKLIVKVPTLAMTCVTEPDVREAYDILKQGAADFAAQYKEADVDMEVVKFDLAEEQAYVTDCFDTEAATDILFEDYFNMNTYVHTGRVVPLDDIITAEWRQDVSEKYWQMSQFKGKTYMLPYLLRQNVVGYHRSLFRQAGLDRYVNDGPAIQSWSNEDWDVILSTLAARLPTHTYALAMYARNEQSDTHTMVWLRRYGSTFFDEEGHVRLSTPEGIAGLQALKDSYDKGYYPPHCEGLEVRDCGKLFWNKQLAVKMINGPGSDSRDADVGLVNFPSRDGKGLATVFVTGFEVFDNGSAEKVKAAKAFLKFFYGTDRYLACSAGNMPLSHRMADAYGSRIYRLQAFRDNEEQVIDFMQGNPNWRGVRSVFYRHIQDLLTGEKSASETAAALDRDCNAAIEEGRQNSTYHD